MRLKKSGIFEPSITRRLRTIQ